MLGSVFSCAVEWQLVDRNPVRAARKPRASNARAAVIAEPEQVEAMRASLLARGRDPALLVLLAYAGLRPGEALALEWRHVRERTLVIEQAVSDGRVKALKNRRPRAVRLLEPLRDDLELRRARAGPVIARSDGRFWRETDWRNWRRRVFRPAAAAAGFAGRPPIRPPPLVRLPPDRRGPPVDRRDRHPAGPQPDGLPRHLRARDGGVAGGAGIRSAESLIGAARARAGASLPPPRLPEA